MTPTIAKKCLVLNDRVPIPEATLASLMERLDVVWCQDSSISFNLASLFRCHRDAQILITTYMDLSAEYLKLLPALELIITTTTAVEYVDLPYCVDHGVIVCNTANYTGNAVAEHAIALLLAVAKKIVPVNERIRRGDLLCEGESAIELAGKQLGIIGLGHIGSGVARMAQGLGMRVVYANRGLRNLPGTTPVQLSSLLRASDAIILTLPLNDASRGMLGPAEFALMKPGAMLISISPEEIIDLAALAEAITEGRIVGVGLDLVGCPPPLLDLPNVLLTTRFAARTPECAKRRCNTWRRTLEIYLHGEPLPARVV
jgi:phosphoglycerate dehydrogenase-like enzyme